MSRRTVYDVAEKLMALREEADRLDELVCELYEDMRVLLQEDVNRQARYKRIADEATEYIRDATQPATHEEGNITYLNHKDEYFTWSMCDDKPEKFRSNCIKEYHNLLDR